MVKILFFGDLVDTLGMAPTKSRWWGFRWCERRGESMRVILARDMHRKAPFKDTTSPSIINIDRHHARADKRPQKLK